MEITGNQSRYVLTASSVRAETNDVLNSPTSRSAIDLASYRQQFAHLRRAADIVRETVLEAILDGYLAPGARLREEELAREFGVSRTPVREALHQLAAIGLIDLNLNQGAVVSRLSIEDILTLYIVRENLEGLAARLAAQHATHEQGKVLATLVEEMKSASADRNLVDLARLNLQFHAEVRQLARSRYLDRFLTQVEHAVRRFSETTFAYPGRTEQSIAEHHAIVEAIIANDPDDAETLARQHMREARQIRLRMLQEESVRATGPDSMLIEER